jgi:hypothetical protein
MTEGDSDPAVVKPFAIRQLEGIIDEILTEAEILSSIKRKVRREKEEAIARLMGQPYLYYHLIIWAEDQIFDYFLDHEKAGIVYEYADRSKKLDFRTLIQCRYQEWNGEVEKTEILPSCLRKQATHKTYLTKKDKNEADQSA